ncbi:MAG TPA: bifunctional molybdenum cofactor biosynthesis protein MoaC/MoaB [Sediminibacterium sp.]|nr:bifunctional molybdenum cofactor biosynthesis protein MoaC/MoaB [Sediminibacterium sp.]
MVNITHKNHTLRTAIALAVVQTSSENTIQAIREQKVPKGDVFSFAKVAALFAVKKTSDIIPDCHPLPVEYTDVRFSINDLSVHIEVEVHTVYKTGVEVEAMHGASVAALTLYDMLKPIDKQVEIREIKLLEKKGGKSQYKVPDSALIKAAVIVCSDRVAAGMAEDTAGKLIMESLQKAGIAEIDYGVIPDEAANIRQALQEAVKKKVSLLIFTGGTGVSPRDITPDTIRPLLDQELSGVMEAARQYGQQRMPYAMLSRGVAGFAGHTLVLTFPGSAKAAAEYMDALFPQVLHALVIRQAGNHDTK